MDEVWWYAQSSVELAKVGRFGVNTNSAGVARDSTGGGTDDVRLLSVMEAGHLSHASSAHHFGHFIRSTRNEHTMSSSNLSKSSIVIKHLEFLVPDVLRQRLLVAGR
jgi:hypothetical protein